MKKLWKLVLVIMCILPGCTTVLTTSKKGGGTQTITISTENSISVDSASINIRNNGRNI